MYNFNPIEKFVKESVEKALTMRPDMAAQIEAAQDIVLAGGVTIRLNGLEVAGHTADVWEDDKRHPVWVIPTYKPGVYVYACACAEYQAHGLLHKGKTICRHTLAVALFKKASQRQREAAQTARHPAYDLADKGAAAVPELLSRMQKAADLVAAGEVMIHAGNAYDVTGTVGTYSITADSCTCADFTYRGGWCKHRLAVRMAQALEQEPVEVPRYADAVIEKRQQERERRLGEKVAADKEAERASWARYCDSSYGKRRYIIKGAANGAKTIDPAVWHKAHGHMQEVK